MANGKPHEVVVIRKSCLTGKVVWIYRGPSRTAARRAYTRACQKEAGRVSHWSETVAQRRANVLRLLTDCTASLPINADLTPRQKKAARELQAIGREELVCHRDFLDHIEERRRRIAEDRRIRREASRWSSDKNKKQ